MEEKVREIARATLLGDLMHVVLDCAKALPKPWQQMNQYDQDDWLAQVDKRCKSAVEQCVTIIAGGDHVAMPATLKSVTFKDGVEAKLVIDRHAQNRIDLADAAGHTVQLVIFDPIEITSDNGKPKAEANQRPLDLAGDDAEAERTDENDAYLPIVRDFVRTSRKCTTSAIQRSLQIGYNRAQRLLEKLELEGVVSAMDGSGKRVVLADHCEGAPQ